MWKTLLDGLFPDHKSDHIRTAIKELVRAGTPAKADLLAEIVWRRYRALLNVEPEPPVRPLVVGVVRENPDPLVLGAARRALSIMYLAGDASLREHIKGLFIAHEGAMPDVMGPSYC